MFYTLNRLDIKNLGVKFYKLAIFKELLKKYAAALLFVLSNHLPLYYDTFRVGDKKDKAIYITRPIVGPIFSQEKSLGTKLHCSCVSI